MTDRAKLIEGIIRKTRKEMWGNLDELACKEVRENEETETKVFALAIDQALPNLEELDEVVVFDLAYKYLHKDTIEFTKVLCTRFGRPVISESELAEVIGGFLVKKGEIVNLEKQKSAQEAGRGRSGHGSCCTCSACGWDYDDCVCSHNQWLEDIKDLAHAISESLKKGELCQQ